MQIYLTDEVAKWYKDEMLLQDGDTIRFSGKVYGVNGFSMILNKVAPSKIGTSTTIDGVTYFIEATDAWFFEDSDVYISIDENTNEPKYDIKK